jgi:hypothetical protein
VPEAATPSQGKFAISAFRGWNRPVPSTFKKYLFARCLLLLSHIYNIALTLPCLRELLQLCLPAGTPRIPLGGVDKLYLLISRFPLQYTHTHTYTHTYIQIPCSFSFFLLSFLDATFLPSHSFYRRLNYPATPPRTLNVCSFLRPDSATHREMADHDADAAIAVDEFAQTRGADDLFDDEIVPITGEQEVQHVHEAPPAKQEQEQPTDAAPKQTIPSTTTTTTTTTRHRGGRGRGNAPADGGRGRGRGRGRGGRGSSDTGPKREQHVPREEAAEAEVKDTESPERQEEQTGEEKKEDETEGKAGKAESARIQAVRGDRSRTGGVKKVWPEPGTDIESSSTNPISAKTHRGRISRTHGGC